MKAKGIVRSIDGLGRIVIPKEIRCAIGAGDGTPMEIFYDQEGRIVMRKYFPGKGLAGQVKALDDAVREAAVELGMETTGDMRGHIQELLALLKEGEKEC